MSFHFKRWKFKPTALLSPEENKEIQDLLDRKCLSLVTTVVQLYHTAPPDHSDWIYKDCGVLCLIQDLKRRKYLFRLYCLIRKTSIWEYELHRNLEYICPARFLSSFEGDECIFGFNFACMNEASAFNAAVFHRISNPDMAGELPSEEQKDKEKKKKLSKKIISKPIEPRHTFHVGFKNLEVMKLAPAEIESYFEKKNIHKKFLQQEPKAVPSVIAPIQVFPKLTNNDQQRIAQKSILKPTSFNSFQQNGAHNFASLPNSPFLQRNNATLHTTTLPKRTTRLRKVSFSTDTLCQSERNLSPSSPTIVNQIETKNNDTMSIDESIAILNGVSDFLKDMQDDIATSETPDLQHQGLNLSAVSEDFKTTLSRRVQAIHSSDDDASDDDDWDD